MCERLPLNFFSGFLIVLSLTVWIGVLPHHLLHPVQELLVDQQLVQLQLRTLVLKVLVLLLPRHLQGLQEVPRVRLSYLLLLLLISFLSLLILLLLIEELIDHLMLEQVQVQQQAFIITMLIMP